MRKKRPTLRDIAQRVGVSETAASFALNGKPGVSEDVRRRVLEVVEELDWRPSYAARLLSGAASQSVGFVLPADATSVDSELFFMRLMMGMQSELSRSQYGLLVQVADTVDEEIVIYERWHSDRRVDGVVMVNLRENDPRPDAIGELGVPAVLAGGPDPAYRIPSVSIDDKAAMRVLLDHVQDLGHRRVAYVCGDRDLLHVQQRLTAFEAVRQGLFDSGQVVSTSYTSSAAAEVTNRILSENPAPTAIICDNEVLAVAVSVTAGALGLEVGKDLTVLSCEDSPVCEAMRPPISALHRDTHGFGADVAAHLLSLIAGSSPRSAQEQLPELVIRDTTSSTTPGLEGTPL